MFLAQKLPRNKIHRNTLPRNFLSPKPPIYIFAPFTSSEDSSSASSGDSTLSDFQTLKYLFAHFAQRIPSWPVAHSNAVAGVIVLLEFGGGAFAAKHDLSVRHGKIVVSLVNCALSSFVYMAGDQ